MYSRSRIEWELLGTGPYEQRNGFGGIPPFRGRGFPPALPPPRWHQQPFSRPRARSHHNYNRNDYNNYRGQQPPSRNRPRPFIRLSNRGGRYYFNERQGYEQGQGRGRGRPRGHMQGHRGRGRGSHLSYSPSSGSDSDEETEYQKKIQVSQFCSSYVSVRTCYMCLQKYYILLLNNDCFVFSIHPLLNNVSPASLLNYEPKLQGMVDAVDDSVICEVFQEMIIGKNIDSARRFLTWGLKHGTSRLALELLMRKHRRY